MLHSVVSQSEARRLTDVLRARSVHGVRFEQRGPVAEQGRLLQMVIQGAVLRQRFLADGRRHTIAVYYQDDVINLGRFAGAKDPGTDYLMALRGTVVGAVEDDAVTKARSAAAPGLDGIGVLVYRELGIAQERMTSLGQRTALEAMAHFFCETLVRCTKPNGNYKVDRCSLHMTQDMLASVLGLSSVHVNRVLQELRHRKLADIVDNELVVQDFDELARVGDFNESYLSPI